MGIAAKQSCPLPVPPADVFLFCVHHLLAMIETSARSLAIPGQRYAAQESGRMKGSADVHAHVTRTRPKPRTRMEFTPQSGGNDVMKPAVVNYLRLQSHRICGLSLI